MATKKKTAAKGVGDSTPTIIRNYDLQSMDKRLRNMEGDTVIPRNYDIFSMEERIHQLEVNGGAGNVASYKIKLGTAITGASVTLETGKFYIFTTVYNTGNFTNANIVLGKKGSLYVKDEIGRMVCIIKATNTAVSFSGSGDVAPNKYIPIVIEKNGEDITSFFFGDFDFTSGASISAAENQRFIVATSDLNETFTGAEVEGSFVMSISESFTDTKVYVIKATADTITYGNKTIYYDRIIGGDIFA